MKFQNLWLGLFSSAAVFLAAPISRAQDKPTDNVTPVAGAKADAAARKTAADKATADKATAEKTAKSKRKPSVEVHYELKRDVFRLTLSGTPVARVLCTVRDVLSGATSTVIWDPDEKGSEVRYALLPKFPMKAGAAARVRELSCRSRQQTVKNSGGLDALTFYKGVSALPIPAPSVTLTFQSLSAGVATSAAALDLTVSVVSAQPPPANGSKLDQEVARVLSQRNGDVKTTRERSVEATVTQELLTAFATYALDKAKTAGKDYARKVIIRELCDGLEVGDVRKQLAGTALASALSRLKWPDERRLLRNTCALVEILRLDELVSAKDAVWKAIAADASELAAEFLRSTLNELGEEPVGGLLAATSALITSTLTGSATTERDAQVLLLALGKVGLSVNDNQQVDRGDWQWAMELGIAVLQECLRGSECSADELGRLLREEIELNGLDPETILGTDNWPELPALLGRAASVLRPPPGTPARTTAANAVTLMLDVVEHALKSSSLKHVCLEENAQALVSSVARGIVHADASAAKNDASAGTRVAKLGCTGLGATWQLYEVNLPSLEAKAEAPAAQVQSVAGAAETTSDDDSEAKTTQQKTDQLRALLVGVLGRSRENALALVRTLRGVITGIQGEDVATAIVELQRVFELAIVDKCEKKAKCKVPVNERQLQRGFRILAAIATYGASYRKPEDGKDSGLLEKDRAEERRKAVESLVDAVTDRSDRRREWVFSLGSNVALGADRRLNEESIPDYTNQVPLSLKTGLAIQYLPGESFWAAGFHGMVTVLDLAQYATLGGDSETEEEAPPEPEFTTALRLGAEAGAVFGEPTFPVTVSAHFGWIPRVNYGEDTRSEWSVGAGVGVFVPFIDFN